MAGNFLMIIFPYRYNDTWVFDDEARDVSKEPFVCGIPAMIDCMVEDIPGANMGFKLIFSASPFPGHQAELTWMREEDDGHWYEWKDQNISGWLCPVLLRFFADAPRRLYIKAEQVQERS
ncbi:DUF6717 family protein [Acidobacteriota bacterium]